MARHIVCFDADEEEVAKLKTGTLDILEGTRPWYSVVHGVDFVSIGFIAVFLLWLSATIAVASKRRGRKKSMASEKSSDKESAIAQLVLFGILAVVFVGGLLFNWIRDSLFPRAVFLIGQGTSRFEGLERFHWGFLIAIVASMIASILILPWQLWNNKAANRSRR